MIFLNHKLPEVYLKVILSLFLRFISFILEMPTPIIFFPNYGELSLRFRWQFPLTGTFSQS